MDLGFLEGGFRYKIRCDFFSFDGNRSKFHGGPADFGRLYLIAWQRICYIELNQKGPDGGEVLGLRYFILRRHSIAG